MDGNLFKKYELRIKKNKKEKEDIVVLIKDTIGVNLEEKEITIKGKKITIQTSSTKRTLLITRNIKNILKEKGYLFP